MPPSSSLDVDLSRADLLSLGTVCASPNCGTRDFLPFRCSFCKKVYCLEHKSHAGCGPESTRVLVCPVCAKAVKLPAVKSGEEITEDAAAAAFDAHARSKDCDPSNYDRVHNKARCPTLHCREKLGPSNRYDCKSCGATTCLKHRHAADHGCAERSAANAAAVRSSRWGRLGGNGGSKEPSSPSSSSSSLARTVSGRLKALFVSCASPGSGGEAERGRNQNQQQQQQRVPPAAAAAAAAARRLAGNSRNNSSSKSTGK